VIKAEWGTKRTCPKCGTRFYDLGKDEPVSWVECGTQWEPEPMLKSKQPLPYDAPKPAAANKEAADTDLAEDLAPDEDEEPNADDDVDLGGDDDIGVETGDEEEEH
jgi:uncharacterized protein (TIGR02300 family)